MIDLLVPGALCRTIVAAPLCKECLIDRLSDHSGRLAAGDTFLIVAARAHRSTAARWRWICVLGSSGCMGWWLVSSYTRVIEVLW